MRLVLVLALTALLAGCSGQSPEPAEEDGVTSTVFVGDSITLGVDLETQLPSDEFSWVRYALAEPVTPWRMQANVAKFGRTLGEMQAGFAAEVLEQHPEGVVIMGGTNDVLRGLPTGESVEALRVMVEQAKADGARVWIVSPPPLDPGYHRPIEPLVAAEADLAAELEVPFVDVHSALVAETRGWPEGMSVDGVHPTAKGARRIAEVVIEAVSSQPAG